VRYISLGSTSVGGTTAQNDPIAAIPCFPFAPKILKGVVKVAGTTWTAGQKIYVTSTNTYSASSTSNTLCGIAAADAASAATTGDVIPASPF
jgi:hypothetical protein